MLLSLLARTKYDHCCIIGGTTSAAVRYYTVMSLCATLFSLPCPFVFNCYWYGMSTGTLRYIILHANTSESSEMLQFFNQNIMLLNSTAYFVSYTRSWSQVGDWLIGQRFHNGEECFCWAVFRPNVQQAIVFAAFFCFSLSVDIFVIYALQERHICAFSTLADLTNAGFLSFVIHLHCFRGSGCTLWQQFSVDFRQLISASSSPVTSECMSL